MRHAEEQNSPEAELWAVVPADRKDSSSNQQNGSPQYQVFMLALCIYVLAALAVEAVLKPDEQTRRLLAYADTALCVVFLADFGWSLYRAENRTRYFLTWGWVDPPLEHSDSRPCAMGTGRAGRSDSSGC